MTPNDEPDPATPLQLATAARVSCTLLEEDIADQIRKPTALRARRLTDRCRDLWQRIDALAGRIEDQQAELERLRMDARPLFQVTVVETPEAMRAFSEAHLAPTVLAPGYETRVVIPDLPAPDIVAEEIPDHPTITAPRCGDGLPKITARACGNSSPLPDLGVRPPGFQEVRRRMQSRRGHRVNPCAVIALPEDRLTSHGSHKRWRPGMARDLEPLWKKIQDAVLAKTIPVGKELTVGQIKEATTGNPGCMDMMCLTLAEMRSPVKMINCGPGRWRFEWR